HGEEARQLRPLVPAGFVHVDEFADLRERQAEALAAQRELEARAVPRRVNAALAGARRRKQAMVLVEADCARRDIELACQLADGKLAAFLFDRLHGRVQRFYRVTAPDYPFANPPAPGTTIEVAPGVHWLRMALPFQLDHINLWLLEDGDGWLQIDTGLGNEPTRKAWEKIIAEKIGAKPVKRVLVTHYHPDHAGNAAWLCKRFDAPLLMTRGEFLTVHEARNSTAGYTTEAQLELFRANGLDEASGSELLLRGGLYRSMVPDFPVSHRRLFEGERVVAGGREWKVILGYGHAPEHVSLHCEALNVLISGDMLLPRISTNVAVRPIDPHSNPLRLFLESI